MRFIIGLPMAIATVALLGGCQSEEAYRASFRTQVIANCKSGAQPSTVAQLQSIGMNVDQLCTCAVDRYMHASTLSQLKADQSNPAAPGLVTATSQCVSEHVAQSTPAAATPDAAAPAPATDAPAAPAENTTAAGDNAAE